MFLALSCGKDVNPGDDASKNEGIVFPAEYVGTVSVNYESEQFDNEGVKVVVRESGTEGLVDIEMLQVQFVPKMPVKVDLTVPSVSCKQQSDGTYVLSVDEVDPLYLGKPFTRYHVSGLSGVIDAEGLLLSLKFGDYPTSFAGQMQ